MNFSFHPLAEQKLLSVVSYYEKCRPGLGGEFAQEVYIAELSELQLKTLSRMKITVNLYEQMKGKFLYG